MRTLSAATLLFACMGVACEAADNPVADWHPMSGAERWHYYLKTTVLSPGLYFASAGSAIGDHLANKPPEWGQGAAGYASRSASQLGLFLTGETMHEAGAAVLDYDPRYRRCDCKGWWSRSGHALKWSFVTRNREGKTRIDFPVLASAYGSGMLSMAWYPQRMSPWTDGVRIGHQQLGLNVGVNIIREFAPDIKRRLLRKD